MTVSRLRIIVLAVVGLLLTGITVLAQDETCPEIVQAALDATAAQCSMTGRNQACYGNVNLEATPQPGIENFSFSTPGDMAAVSAIEKLTLSSRVAEAGEWGIALLQLQANLPDSLPGQNVTFLLFGAVEITNGVEADGTLNPMQAFYFNSGTGDAPCAEAPDSGILVQTPEGAARIEFVVNDVSITLGSTAYLQAQPGGQMTTSVVEGEATVTAGGVSVDVPAGSQVQVPLDAQGQADGTPSDPQPYDGAKMAVLPTRILPRTITVAAPITAGGGILLTEGEWTWTPGTPSGDGCEPGVLEFVVSDFTPDAPFHLPAGEFSWTTFGESAYGQPPPPESIFGGPEANTYTMDIPTPGFSWHYEARVIDSTHIEGAFTSGGESCTIEIPFTMTGESAVGVVPAAGEWEAAWVPPSISCDVVSDTLNGTLTWDMSYYASFDLPEGEFSPALLYGSVLGFDMAGKDVNTSSPEANQYVMDFSDPIGDVHFEVQVIDSDHMAGNYTLTKSNCVFSFSYEMARVGN